MNDLLWILIKIEATIELSYFSPGQFPWNLLGSLSLIFEKNFPNLSLVQTWPQSRKCCPPYPLLSEKKEACTRVSSRVSSSIGVYNYYLTSPFLICKLKSRWIRIGKHRKAKSHLLEYLLIPMMVDVMKFLSRYPPFKEEEEKTVYEKDDCINRTGEGAEVHRPKRKGEITTSRKKKFRMLHTFRCVPPAPSA